MEPKEIAMNLEHHLKHYLSLKNISKLEQPATSFDKTMGGVISALETVTVLDSFEKMPDQIVFDTYKKMLNAACERLKVLKYPDGVKEAADILESLCRVKIDYNVF